MRRFVRALVLALSIVALALPARADWWDEARNVGPGEIGLNKTTGGGLIGAALGGLLGSQLGKGDGRLIGTAIGVLGGAWLGSTLGRQLDEADRSYEQRAGTRALTAPIGQEVAWKNPDSGNSGALTPMRSWREPGGTQCRDIERRVTIDGMREDAMVTACRDRNGNWVVRP